MSDERDWTQQEFDDLKAAADYEGGWYYAKHADNFPQYSDEKLNGYSGPFASEHEAWVHYMETGEADLNAAHTMLADARAALAERDALLNKGANLINYSVSGLPVPILDWTRHITDTRALDGRAYPKNS